MVILGAVTVPAPTEPSTTAVAGARRTRCGRSDRGAPDVLGTASSGRLSDERLREWVARSCVEQGVPLHVTDVLVLERVRVLLTGTAAPGRPHPRRAVAPVSESPDRLHPLRVQGAGAQDAGADDGVVQHGADDGGLPGEVQLIPGSA